jgi:uncharacterized YccA/Bax inhibitor family protein
MFRSSNPTLREGVFERAVGQGEMTFKGTVGKIGLLLAILLACVPLGWNFPSLPLLIGGIAIGFGLALFLAFRPNNATWASPVYAAVEGYVVGAVSVIVSQMLKDDPMWRNAVPLAIGGTLVVFCVMLGLYATRVIRVTETFRSVVIGATLALMLTYVGSWLISVFWPGVWNTPIFGSGWAGLAFSAVAIVVASLNFALDFDRIENGVQAKAPKFMEWYCAFGLLVTLVWLYIELLT